MAIAFGRSGDLDTKEFDRLAEKGDAANLSEALALVQAPLLTDAPPTGRQNSPSPSSSSRSDDFQD